MNPIIIIIAAALVLSALVVVVLNKPAFPFVTVAFILVLVYFVVSTYLVDTALSSTAVSDELSRFINFTVMKDNPSYEDLESSFNIFMITDIALFVLCAAAMFFEAMVILRKNVAK